MAQKDYQLIYSLYVGDPIDIHSSIGPLPLLLDHVISIIDNVEDIQLMDNETKKIIAQTRGDAIIIKDTVPAAFNLFIKSFFAHRAKEAKMAVSRNKKTENKETDQAQALTIEVLRAHDLTKDDQEGCNIAVDLKINGVTIYGCFYREGKDKNGKDYQMVSFPSHQGKDGKYYNYAYVKLTDEDVEKISKDIEKLL